MIQQDMNWLASISLLKTQCKNGRGAKSIATIPATLIPNPFHCANTSQWFTETASKKTPKCSVLLHSKMKGAWESRGQTNDGISNLIGPYG